MIKRILFTIIALFLFFNWAYPSSKKESKDIINLISKTYSIDVNNENISTLVNETLKSGVPADQIKDIIKRSYQYGKSFSEVTKYIEIIYELSKDGILSDHVVNVILEGLAKGASSNKIFRMIDDEKNKWKFCAEVSKKIFGESGLNKKHEERANIEKNILMLMDIGFNKNGIKELSLTIRKNGKDADYFNVVLKVALEIKSMGWKDKSIIKVLTVAIKNNINSSELMDYLNMILNKVAEGKNEDEITESIINNMESKKEKKESTYWKKAESNRSMTSHKGESSKPGGEHNENKPGGMGSHKKE